MNEKATIDSNTIDNDIMNTSQKVDLYRKVYAWITNGNNLSEWFFSKMVQLFIDKRNSQIPFTYNDIIKCLKSMRPDVDFNVWQGHLSVLWGIINTLSAASIFDKDDAEKDILDMVNNKLSHTSPVNA